MSYRFPVSGGTSKDRRMALLLNVIWFGAVFLLLNLTGTCSTKQKEGDKMKTEAERQANELRQSY